MIRGYKYIFTLLLLCFTTTITAQRNEVISQDIATLQVRNVNQPLSMLPIIQLNSNEQIQISFDRFGHEYHRYTYNSLVLII